MRRVFRQATILLLLGGYSLTVTVGGAFHTHLGVGCCGEHDGGQAEHCHGHLCDVVHAHATPADHGDCDSDALVVEAVGVPFDEHCPICSFLSQKPISTSVQECEASADLWQPLVRVKAISRSDDIPTTVFSRGPPSIA